MTRETVDTYLPLLRNWNKWTVWRNPKMLALSGLGEAVRNVLIAARNILCAIEIFFIDDIAVEFDVPSSVPAVSMGRMSAPMWLETRPEDEVGMTSSEWSWDVGSWLLLEMLSVASGIWSMLLLPELVTAAVSSAQSAVYNSARVACIVVFLEFRYGMQETNADSSIELLSSLFKGV